MSASGVKALFLDRDGVINLDHGYVHRIEQVEFRDGIFELVRAAKLRGYAVVVVTNQAGIGRGFYTEDDFQRLTAWMLTEFEGRDASIDRIYHCPDHPEFGVGAYRRESMFRKPGPGMLLKAATDLGLTLPDSVMVGDTESDIEAGIRAGLRCNVLVIESGADFELARQRTRADVVVSSLHAIVAYL